MNLNNVQFLKRVPPAKIGKYLAAADVLLVHLKKNDLFEITIPSKTQAYMMAGKPIIMAVSGDAASLIKESKSGLLCEPENPDELTEKIMNIFNMKESERIQIGINGKTYYENYLSIHKGTKAMVNAFNEVVLN